jgi:hypothetical protein
MVHTQGAGWSTFSLLSSQWNAKSILFLFKSLLLKQLLTKETSSAGIETRLGDG